MGKFKEFYINHYKKLMLIPILLLLISVGALLLNYNKTGEFINKDVTLTGGITSTIYSQDSITPLELETLLENELNTDFNVRGVTNFGSNDRIGYIIEATDITNNQLRSALEGKLKFSEEDYSIEEIGPGLGQSFYKQMIWAIIFAFLFMAIVVLIAFKSLTPSLAVVLAAFTDMIFVLGFINIFKIKLGTAGIAAILLLIGYSVDTDILLTTNVLKRREEGDVFDRIINSMKTGLTMTATTFIALLIAFFVSNSIVLKQVFLILLIGLFYDIFATYLTNAYLLIRYAKKKGIN